MDFVSHAIAGACTGAYFGKPITGAVIAVLPDLPIVGPRRALPPALYNATHSLAAVAAVAALGAPLGLHWLFASCWLSHLFLDLPTHGKSWGPTLFWPYRKRCSLGDEWEWFNASHKFGLAITTLWSVTWLTHI